MSDLSHRRLTGLVSRVESSLTPISVRMRGPWTRIERVRDDPARWPAYIAAVAISLVVATVLLPFREALGPTNVLLLFVFVNIGTALILGSGPAAAASVLGFFVVNFLFIEPYYSVSIDTRDYILALVIYLGVSLITGQLVARLTQRTQQALREQRRVSLLYDLNSALIGEVTLDAMLDTIVQQVVTVYGSDRGRRSCCRSTTSPLMPTTKTRTGRRSWPSGQPRRTSPTMRQSTGRASRWRLGRWSTGDRPSGGSRGVACERRTVPVGCPSWSRRSATRTTSSTCRSWHGTG